MKSADLRMLDCFDTVNWQRPIYVNLTHPKVAHLVEQDYLEGRTDPDSHSKGQKAREYRLTPKGVAVLIASGTWATASHSD